MSPSSRFVILFIPLVLSSPTLPLQAISVKGKLKCGQFALTGTVVKLIDIDLNDKDDLLDVGLTDENGLFSLTGHTREDEVMQSALKIYHNCGDRVAIHESANDKKKKVCAKKVVWEIPVEYNTDGTVTKWFDVGEVNMELTFRGQERDCRH